MHCHHALRGAMKTRGASFALLPEILAVTLNACAAVRIAWTTSVASAWTCNCSLSHSLSALDTCSIGGPDGFLNARSLLRNSPGLLPRVRSTTHLCGLRLAVKIEPCFSALGSASLNDPISSNPISVSLPTQPSFQRPPWP